MGDWSAFLNSERGADRLAVLQYKLSGGNLSGRKAVTRFDGFGNLNYTAVGEFDRCAALNGGLDDRNVILWAHDERQLANVCHTLAAISRDTVSLSCQNK